VGELMFEGYEDELITLGDAFSDEKTIPMDKFGWFYKVISAFYVENWIICLYTRRLNSN